MTLTKEMNVRGFVELKKDDLMEVDGGLGAGAVVACAVGVVVGVYAEAICQELTGNSLVYYARESLHYAGDVVNYHLANEYAQSSTDYWGYYN